MKNFPSSGTLNALSGISGIISGIGGFMSAKQDTATGEYNAQIFEQQASAERESQRLFEIQKRRAAKSVIGSQIAQTGASGFKFTGDPITIMVDSLANSELDIAIDKYNSELKARGFLNSAQLERYEARKKASSNYISAATSFLGVAADQYTKNSTLGGTKYGPYGGRLINGKPVSYLPGR